MLQERKTSVPENISSSGKLGDLWLIILPKQWLPSLEIFQSSPWTLKIKDQTTSSTNYLNWKLWKSVLRSTKNLLMLTTSGSCEISFI